MGWTDLRAANTTRLKYVKPWVYHIQIYIYYNIYIYNHNQSYNHKAFWQGKTTIATAVNLSNMVYVNGNTIWLHPHVMVDPTFSTGKVPAYVV